MYFALVGLVGAEKIYLRGIFYWRCGVESVKVKVPGTSRDSSYLTLQNI